MLIFGFLVMLVFVVGLFLPRKFEVKHQIGINAAASEIFPEINEIRKWPEWTVWNVQNDPTLRLTFEGPAEGVGAKELWYSDRMGDGSIEIVYSSLNTALDYEMITQEGRFKIYGSFVLAPSTTGTTLAWKSKGNLPFNPVSRYFGVFMEYLIGPDMEFGLKRLKERVESGG